jgi:hypothetical protein
MIEPPVEFVEIESIRQLKSRYFRFLDSKQWDGLATIFAEAAIFDARLASTISAFEEGDPTWYAEGRENIVSFIRRVVEHRVTVHHGHDHEVELLSPNHARGVVALEDWIWDRSGSNQRLLLHGWGHYSEEYRRDTDGWRVVRSTLTRLNLITA